MSARSIENDIAAAVHELLQPYIAPFHAMKIEASDGEVLVKGEVTAEDLGLTTMLRVVVNHEDDQILIPNILMPSPIKQRGLGKELIARILRVAQMHSCELFVVDLVPSFYRRLVARGAVSIEANETVLITKETDLSHKFG